MCGCVFYDLYPRSGVEVKVVVVIEAAKRGASAAPAVQGTVTGTITPVFSISPVSVFVNFWLCLSLKILSKRVRESLSH
jgi:hypothetical protein